jgi:hypothetical protein
MPQNWHEIPSVVQFCNEMDMPLMFTTVESPTECSLQALEAEALAEMEQVLGKTKLPQSNDLQRQNAQTFADLVLQLKGWKEIAAAKASAGIHSKAASLDEYLMQLEVLIRREKSQEETQSMLSDIEMKLNFLIKTAETHGLAHSATQKIIGTPHELILRSVPGLDKERLLELFKSFVMPLD